MVFKIETFEQLSAKSDQVYRVSGTINVPGLYVQNNNSYDGTSYEVIRGICKELGIGFNSNIDATNDKMPWRNTNKKPYELINDIISRSYISDDSYMAGYIDHYYCFNYVDLEKEMNRDASKDMGLDTSGLSQQSSTDESKRLIPLRLTTDDSRNTSSNYIGKYVKSNDSTKKSLQNGYATITKTYDRITKKFLVFKVDSTTSDGSESHILKDNINDDKYKNENIIHKFIGKLDTDNVHDNYNYSATQNRINLNNLTKISLEVSLPNANWNIYKFQKIYVEIINAVTTIASESQVDWRYSGYYIISDIEYNWSGGKMSQELRLIRKELGKTPEEVKNGPPVKQKEEVKENNPNPEPKDDSKPIPNSVYNVGQVYLVQDKDGKKYELTVTSLLQNGTEVTGTLKSKL
jgi:hypothetical protein